MARAALFSGPTIRVESTRDHNGRTFTAWKPHASRWFDNRKDLLRWLSWPPKTPTGDALRAWLNDLEAQDAQRSPAPQPDGLSPEVIATGFGPEAHLDPSDPNYETRTVI